MSYNLYQNFLGGVFRIHRIPGPQALIDWDGYVCRWFDYHLKQIPNGVLDDPPAFAVNWEVAVLLPSPY